MLSISNLVFDCPICVLPFKAGGSTYTILGTMGLEQAFDLEEGRQRGAEGHGS